MATDINKADTFIAPINHFKSAILIIINIIVLISTSAFCQTKNETINYLNNILKLHSNGTVECSFSEFGPGDYLLNKHIILPNHNSLLVYKLDPKKAQYISYTTNGEVTTFIMSFVDNSVLSLSDDGKVIEELNSIKIYSVINITEVEINKFIKAYSRLIELGGGLIKKDPFE